MKTKIIAVVAMCLAASSVWAALDDYTLRRLPISLAKQFEDANGNLRVILPSFINDNGIMGGVRLTWERPLDGEGNPGAGVTRLVNQSGYLYDLNTRSFIAQHIAGQIVTYVGADNYISKRLHPSARRWQTYRCPISGLVQRPDSTLYDNPACVLIDNDFLNQTPPQGTIEAYWASQYITVNMLGVSGFGYGATNAAGSSVVWDLDDNYPVYDEDQYNLYRANGQTFPVDETLYTAAGVDPSQAPFGLVTTFGLSDNKDTIWAGVRTDGSFPASVYKLQFQEDGAILTTSIQLNQVIDGGTYADVHGVSKNGLIVTSAGTCTFDSGCTDTSLFTTPVEFTGTSPLLLNNRIWVAANLPNQPSGLSIVDLRGAQPEAVSVEALVYDKFNETPATTGGGYVFPQTTQANGTVGASISVSESGHHLVFGTKTQESGYRLYYFRKN